MDNRNNCIITKSKDNTAFYSQRVIVLAFILIFLTISNSFGEPKLITCVELSNFFDPKTDYEVIMIEGNEIVCRIPLPGEAVIVDTENASPVYAIKGKSSTMLAQVSDNGKILHFAEFHSFDCEPDEILYVSESSVVYSNEVGIVTRSANSSEKEYVLPLELNDSLVFYSVSHGGDIAVCSNADLFVKYGDESVWRHIFSASRSMSTNTEVGIPLCWVDSTLFFFCFCPLRPSKNCSA